MPFPGSLPGYPGGSDDPALKEYFAIAPRNVSRARIRPTVEKYPGRMGPDREPRDAAMYLNNEPSGNELLPLVQ